MVRWVNKLVREIKVGVRSEQPLEVGKAFTKAFLALVALLAILPQHTSEDGWSFRILSLLFSPSNEIGDTFAGIAGVLAFLWIIVTVWLQSQELAEQREELRLTRLEMQEQRKAAEKMAASAGVQAGIFKKEQDQREQDIASRQMDAYLELVLLELSDGNLRGVLWEYKKKKPVRSNVERLQPFASSHFSKKDQPRLVFETLVSQVRWTKENLLERCEEVDVVKRSEREAELKKLGSLLDEIVSLKPELPKDKVLQLEIWKIEESHSVVSSLLAADIWKDQAS